MIEVKVRKHNISVSGHAGYAARGSDIVCAAVSTLVQTLIQSIEDLSTDKIKYHIWPGMVDIEYEDLSEKSKTLIDSFFVGILMIANDYPDNVQIV